MASIVKTNDRFPPEQIKEKLGSLSVAMAKSTEPANKLSLCSSRISTLIGILEYKCGEWVEPGLSTVLYRALIEMARDMQSDKDLLYRNGLADQTMENLIKYFNDKMDYNITNGIKFVPKEGIELLTDYNRLLACRARWKDANDAYMKNHNAWGYSNKLVADIGDLLETIEMKYNLIIMPKNYSYSIDQLSLLKKDNGE